VEIHPTGKNSPIYFQILLLCWDFPDTSAEKHISPAAAVICETEKIYKICTHQIEI
jgi:hypothetical protein